MGEKEITQKTSEYLQKLHPKDVKNNWFTFSPQESVRSKCESLYQYTSIIQGLWENNSYRKRVHKNNKENHNDSLI
jgi:hypothetical protein